MNSYQSNAINWEGKEEILQYELTFFMHGIYFIVVGNSRTGLVLYLKLNFHV